MLSLTNKQFSDELACVQARFVLCDLHFHGPASYDVRGSRFESLEQEEQDLIRDVPIADPQSQSSISSYQKEILAKYPVDTLIARIVKRRNVIAESLNLSTSDDWALVAITDHNVCAYSCNAAKKAWIDRAKNRLIILPAIELDVNFEISSTENVTIHLILIFAPETDEQDIVGAITNASGKQWKEGEPFVAVKSLPDFVSKLRYAKGKHPAVCIAAHVSSNKGVQKESKKVWKLLSRDAAEVSRLRGELQALQPSDPVELKQELEEKLKAIEATMDADASLEVLRLIGECGLDGLQVSKPDDKAHYRRLHRNAADRGRSAPIVCSDAHSCKSLFDADDYIPHLKLTSPLASATSNQLFADFRNSLRFGETRFTCRPPGRVETWIEGLVISADSEEAAKYWGSGSQVFRLSRNLNCIIGGRGSGKSTLLDAIGFVARPEDYTKAAFSTSRGEAQEQYLQRSAAVFSGNHIKICWRYAGQEVDSAVRKGLFVGRYFDKEKKMEGPVLEDVAGKALTTIFPPLIEIYRFQELERHASGPALRILLDGLNATELLEAENQITSRVKELREGRSRILDLAKKIAALTQPGKPLRIYAENVKRVAEIDTSEMQTTFALFDDAEAAGRVIGKTNEAITEIETTGDFNLIAEKIKNIPAAFSTAQQEITTETDEFMTLKSVLNLSNPQSFLSIFETRYLEAHASLISLKTQVTTLLTAARGRYKEIGDGLNAKGMPKGSIERKSRRAALQESKQALEQYRVLWGELEKALEARRNTLNILVLLCQRRTEIREQSCAKINLELSTNLDPNVLVIRANPGSKLDNSSFTEWLNQHLSPVFKMHRTARATALTNSGLLPSELRDLLLYEGNSGDRLIVAEEYAENGRITSGEARQICEYLCAIGPLKPEAIISSIDQVKVKELPAEIVSGLKTFPCVDDDKEPLRLEAILKLDEIVINDRPYVEMNDRPMQQGTKPRPLERLSPGQRCSALLPILLLNGTGPLLVDQPEDNLDNRLIREVIVNVLATMKLRRQVIIATHNPNLPVLGDSEQVVALAAIGERNSEIICVGNLDDKKTVKEITDIMEGGREAFQFRESIYGAHWDGPVATE